MRVEMGGIKMQPIKQKITVTDPIGLEFPDNQSIIVNYVEPISRNCKNGRIEIIVIGDLIKFGSEGELSFYYLGDDVSTAKS